MGLRTCTSMGSTTAATAAAAAAGVVHSVVSLVYTNCLQHVPHVKLRIVGSGASLSQGVEMGCEQPTDCCVGTDTECRCSSCCAWCQLNTACHVYAAELFTLWPVYWLPDLHLQADCRSPAHHYKKLLLLVLQQVSERVKQVLCKAATDLTKHGPDNAIVEHAPYATEQVAV